jgi:hypothetical protein
MDLFFTAGSVLIMGIIFAGIVYYVSYVMGFSYDVEEALVEPLENYVSDVSVARTYFDLDIRQLKQFLLGNQNSNQLYIWTTENYGGRNRAKAVINGEILDPSTDLSKTGDIRNDKYEMSRLDYVVEIQSVPGDASPAMAHNVYDISGVSGEYINIINQFCKDLKARGFKTVRVERFNLGSYRTRVESDGSITAALVNDSGKQCLIVGRIKVG